MNNVLQLKGKLENKSRGDFLEKRNLPKSESVKLSHIKNLRDNLQDVINYWKQDNFLEEQTLLTVYYKRIIAKGNRIEGILPSQSKSIVGARFAEDGQHIKHFITHCVPLNELQTAYDRINNCIDLLSSKSLSEISYGNIASIYTSELTFDFSKIKQKTFITCILDSFYIEKFGVDIEKEDYSNDCIVTLFETGIPTSKLLEKIGISYIYRKSIDENTLLLEPKQYELIRQKAPYLIAMSVEDLSKIEPLKIFKKDYISDRKIPAPKNEPVIGVIDTRFDTDVYFSSWVEYENKLSSAIPVDYNDFHGNYVSSIIVDGPALNPELEDGCGRFRVKHFCVTTTGIFSSYSIMKSIQEIVTANSDIKVWNISLGSKMEIKKKFISPEAYILDRIQYENDVIFVIAGTNKTLEDIGEKKNWFSCRFIKFHSC